MILLFNHNEIISHTRKQITQIFKSEYKNSTNKRKRKKKEIEKTKRRQGYCLTESNMKVNR